MFDHLLESCHQDDSNRWSKKGFGEEISQVGSIKIILHTLSGDLVMAKIHSYLYK